MPLSKDVNVYYDKEIKHHLPESWMDRSKDKIGYEINLTQYFYKFTPLRSLKHITEELDALDSEIKKLMIGIKNGY